MLMEDIIKTKRKSLEQFIREQMIGPNGCMGKYSYNDENFDAAKQEIVNTTPGSIYSSAILFPKKKEADNEVVQNGTQDDEDMDDDNQSDDSASLPSDQNDKLGLSGADVDDEDVCSLSRRFPNSIGLSCCLAPDTCLSEDVEISVSGRYYTKVPSADYQKVVVAVKEPDNSFQTFWDENPSLGEYFMYEDNGVTIKRVRDNIGAVKQLLNNELDKKCAEKIASEGGFLDIVPQMENRFLQSYKEKLFNSKLNRLTTREGQPNTYLSDDEKSRVLGYIREIEKYQRFLSYFKDLISLYDRKSYGYWMSHSFEEKVSLAGIVFDNDCTTKQIYKPSPENGLANIVHVELPPAHNDAHAEKRYLSLSVWLQVITNNRDRNDSRLYLKVTLQNTSTEFEEDSQNHLSIVNEEVNRLCFFGIRIDVRSAKLQPYHVVDDFDNIDKEKEKLDYLYRSVKDYGVGHFCSADWNAEHAGEVDHVFTEFLPSYETPDIEPVPRDKYGEYVREGDALVPPTLLGNAQCLQFKWLSTFSAAHVSDDEVRHSLQEFVDKYQQWIVTMREHCDNAIGEANLDACKKDADRMSSNVQHILSEDENMRVFRMMNAAMFMQLWHNKEANQMMIHDQYVSLDADFYARAEDDLFVSGKPAAWRPFQLAFILLNLDGIIKNPNDNNWKYRNDLVDLVWFPTGGGKTEAYLGIIALCIIYRRRKYGNQGEGVAAIMRYTLRLLTTQQFQRALRMILALDQIRRWRNTDEAWRIGDSPITIGLFVGSLPKRHRINGNNDRDCLDFEGISWNERQDGQNRTKIPLDRCPWCGGRLEYSQQQGIFKCGNINCDFSDSLPVRLCDEHIYRTPPSLLFGTVDKFASLARKVESGKNGKKEDSRRLFGHGTDCLPPDLVIQDELHLLLGPLGSAVSLFECAIDQLCTRDGVRPKIIASTATTRNTELQIRALYDRDANIFPKNGIDHDDSFFAFSKRVMNGDVEQFVSKRKYMGIMPTGRTQMTTQMRLTAMLLVHRALFEQNYSKEPDFEKAADYYYSVISYFNSLREVGKTDAMFYTEFTKYVKRLFNRVMREGNLLECFYANEILLKKSELTGRLEGSDINDTFAKVGQRWTVKDRLPHQDGNGEWVRATTPPDFILATNMISVGLDVSRFNTMIVNSMPRNIAEYIQASSRVARDKEGLVLMLHNPFRARDVSHYEKFREFHEKLYYYVEPISITPFSQKSVEKFLPLYLATVVRHKFSQLADNRRAIDINNGTLKDDIKRLVKDYFRNRFSRTQSTTNQLLHGLLTQDLYNNIEKFVDEAIEEWGNTAIGHTNAGTALAYTQVDDRYRNQHTDGLFFSPNDYEETKNDSHWTVPVALRIVEPEAVLKIIN